MHTPIERPRKITRVSARAFAPLITLSILIAIAILLRMAAPASAQSESTFTVDTTTDAVDTTPGDGICATAEGTCTLRAAIQEANILFGADTILLGPGVHKLSIAGTDEYGGATGDLDVADSLGIIGSEAGSTVSADWLDRVLHVSSGTRLDLRDVTLTRGTAEGDSATDAGLGGAIFADSGSEIVLTNVRLVQNRASLGGAIFARGGSVSLDGVTFAGNVATESGGAATIGQGDATITNTSFDSNVASERGGGLYAVESDVSVTASVFSSNAADFGGGLAAAGGTLQLAATEIDSNNATEQGGGLWLSGAATVISSSITRNGSTDGGGVAVVPALGPTDGESVASFEEIFFAENSSSNAGGAIWSTGNLSVQRVMIGQNSAGSGAMDIHLGGDDASRAEIVNAFFQSQQIDEEIPSEVEVGGASVVVDTQGDVTLINNTLVGYGSVGNASVGVSLIDGALMMRNSILLGYGIGMESAGGTFAGDHNLYFANGVDVAGTAIGPNSLVDLDPMLEGLVGDGDMLRQRSPATDVGDNAVCPALDRLGQPRPKDGGGDLAEVCDIGSFEIQFPVNDPPIAVSDQITITRDDVVALNVPFVLPVAANDVDPNGDPLTVISTTLPSHGEILFNADGSISYARTPNFNGTDVFTYTVTDGRGETSSAMVELLVIPGLTIGERVSFGEDWQIGDGTQIGRDVLLGDGIRFGTDVVINRETVIGNGVVLGSQVMIWKLVQVGDGTQIGAGALVEEDSVIGADVAIGAMTRIAESAVVSASAQIGANVTLLDETSVGVAALLADGVQTGKRVMIGDGVQLGENVIVEKGTQINAESIVGAGALIKAATQIGGAVQIGADAYVGKRVQIGNGGVIGEAAFVSNDVTLGNAVQIGAGSKLGNHVTIGEESVLAAMVNVDHFGAIGERVQIGTQSEVRKNAAVGADSLLGTYVVIEVDAQVGARVEIGDGGRVRRGESVPDDAVVPGDPNEVGGVGVRARRVGGQEFDLLLPLVVGE